MIRIGAVLTLARNTIKASGSSAKYLCSSVFICGCMVFNATAEVTVKDAWVRGTVPSQTTTGAFMTITSSEDAKLVGASTPIAKMTEIHQSTMKDGVAHMHEAQSVALPAGKPVELKPGGYHLMIMGVTKPVAKGEKIPFQLTIEDRSGKKTKVDVKAEVRPLGQ